MQEGIHQPRTVSPLSIVGYLTRSIAKLSAHAVHLKQSHVLLVSKQRLHKSKYITHIKVNSQGAEGERL